MHLFRRALACVAALGLLSCGSPPPAPPPQAPPPVVAAPLRSPPPAPSPRRASDAEWPTFERSAAPPESVPDGSIANADTVVAGMGRHLKRCYDRELVDNPLAAGSFRLRAHIGAAGDVENVVAHSLVGNLSGSLLKCCADVVRSRWFAKPPGGAATLELPLKLAPDPKPQP